MRDFSGSLWCLVGELLQSLCFLVVCRQQHQKAAQPHKNTMEREGNERGGKRFQEGTEERHKVEEGGERGRGKRFQEGTEERHKVEEGGERGRGKRGERRRGTRWRREGREEEGGE